MKALIFEGESLWLGNLGHAFIVTAFVSALLAIYWYYLADKRNDDGLKSLARRAFLTNVFSIIGVFITLFVIILTHKYEYHYAWRHSSNDLPIYYMISCFWEGQEGSFLLWMFWIALLGAVLIKSAGEFEAPVLITMALMQLVLGSMILGLETPWFKIGSSPFILTREASQELLNIPVLQSIGKEKYLTILKDGNGLNPLLQNYWMVIHPPTLFLGFALATVPFAYSLAGFYTGKIRQVITPALIWSLICVGVMGTGIIMGGFWAYESLSFGGYWAWDPVENASLMPWLIAASAAHMLLITRATGRHVFTSHLLTQIAFWLVLYATFLTRSGILGNASVHSFTDLGLSGQLLILLFAFLVLGLAVIPQNKKHGLRIMAGFVALVAVFVIANVWADHAKLDITLVTKYVGYAAFGAWLFFYIRTLYQRTKVDMPDETLFSRELWMLLGSLFLILSLLQVFVGTSMPVFNKLFGLSNAVPKAEDYNNIQLWLAMPVMLMMAFGQYLQYKESKWQKIGNKLIIAVLSSIVVSLALIWIWNIKEIGYMLFLFSSVFLILGNIIFTGKNWKTNWLNHGATIAHAGFGILLLGVLVSSVNKKVLTSTENGINLFSEADKNPKAIKENRENRLLYQNEPVQMGDYLVTYKSVEEKGIDKYFSVEYAKKSKEGQIQDQFELKPHVQNNPKMGLLANPDTRHYLHKDIFTHINFESEMQDQEPFSGFSTTTVKIGEPFLTESAKTKLTILGLTKETAADSALKIKFQVKVERPGQTQIIEPSLILNAQLETEPVVKNDLGLFMEIPRIEVPPDNNNTNPADLKITVVTAERAPVKPFIVMKVIEFPWINLVWAGTIIMVLGISFAVFNRIRQWKLMLK